MGDQVLEAIQKERFYVFTHPEWQSLIEHRLNTVLKGGIPSTLPPPGNESLISKLATLRSKDPTRK